MRVLAGLLFVLVLAAPAGAEPPDAVDEVYSGGGYQTQQPDADTAERPGRPPPRRPPRASRNGGPTGVGSLFTVLLWIALGVCAVLLVAWLGGRLTGYTADRRAVEEPATSHAAAPAPLDAPLGDAEALAREGRYGEAIHTLLLETLRVLAGRTSLPPSLTSREILTRLDLADEARGALGGLVGAVEIFLFGGRRPDAAAYRACVDHHRRFAAVHAREGA